MNDIEITLEENAVANEPAKHAEDSNNGEISISLPNHIELEPGEEAVFATRQHWYVFRDPVLVALFIPFLLMAGAFFIDYTPLPANAINWGQAFFTWGAGIVFLLGLGLFIWKLFLWQRTTYIVTNKRIILVTRYGPFTHDDRETGLEMIQDVKAEINGLQPTLYGFGNVVMQVSSEDARLVFEKVGKPHEVQRIIMREAHLR